MMGRYLDDRLIVRTPMAQLRTPIPNPLDPTQTFLYQSSGYGRAKDAKQADYRVQVYAPAQEDLGQADKVCVFLMLLWDMLTERLGYEHPIQYEQVVTVYLVKGGKPGGEQKVTSALEGGKQVARNSIFLYDHANLTDPMELCRELAHEYGHATLPNVGGFDRPEYWANGYLGERLFLRWLAADLESKRITKNMAFDIDLPALRSWLAKNVDPLGRSVLTGGFDASGLGGKDEAACDCFLALFLAADSLYGSRVVGRALKLSNGTAPKDAYAGLVRAVAEKESLTFAQPGPFWALLPGDWNLTGATVGKRREGWMYLTPNLGAGVTAKRR